MLECFGRGKYRRCSRVFGGEGQRYSESTGPLPRLYDITYLKGMSGSVVERTPAEFVIAAHITSVADLLGRF
ncbi:hypothetical protein UFOVP221_41 [uncultured Caudovirales phage]|uniref:Uncharacterized protein n=1 Tax=uncultured Caudovirales phage TaxID=2100421 RepID=A0A6J7WQW3_9CAUD|nr:hypothetical protein UFOVP221_41 [uncultured Caudovirales phage]